MIPAAVRIISLLFFVVQSGAGGQQAVAEAAQGTALARDGQYDLAIEHYQAALRLDRHLPGLYLNLGLAYFKSKRLPEAATAFEEAVRADGSSFQAHALLGMSYYGCSRYADAATQLKMASAEQPGNLELRYTLAKSYLLSKQYPNALAEFQFLLTKNPDSAPVHVLLGQALDASNQVEAATAEFELAAKATSVPPEVHFGLGYLYWKQQRFEEASREFQAELKGQPEHALALAYLADAEMHTDRDEGAEAHLRQALAVDANTRLAQLDLGILLASRNDSDAAAHCFREAIRIDPSKPDAHYRLGRLWSSLGREQDAQGEFEIVKSLAAEQPPPPLVQLAGRPQQ